VEEEDDKEEEGGCPHLLMTFRKLFGGPVSNRRKLEEM